MTIVFQGNTVEPGTVEIEVKYTKPLLSGVSQELNKWQRYMRVNDQSLADLAEELIEGEWDGSEYRIKESDYDGSCD